MGLANRTPLRRGAGSPESVGRKLIDVPGYVFRILVTTCSDLPEEVRRDYNRGSDMENRIAELKQTWGPTASA